MPNDQETLLEFPCQFPIKAMGRADHDLKATVTELVSAHVDDVTADDVRVQPSRRGNYVSVTVTITATSKQQIDNIYLALSEHEAILMTL